MDRTSAEPDTGTDDSAPAAGCGASNGFRDRVSGSRLGNVFVLLVTAALVAGGAWFLNRPEAPAAGTGDGSTASSAVDVAGGSDVPAPKVGQPVPDFAAVTTDGKRVALKDLRGKPVWISFVATWCSSCRAEAPDMQTIHQERGAEVEMISFYLSEDAQTVTSYAEKLGMSYHQAADPKTDVASAYRVMAVPTHFFVDANGVLRDSHVGVLSRAQMDESLQKLEAR